MALQYEIKVVLLGDPAVGKTSIARRLAGEPISIEYLPTIKVSVYEKKYNIKGVIFTMRIWDPPGDLTYANIPKEFFIDSKIALLTLEVSRISSYVNIDKWYNVLATRDTSRLLGLKVCKKCGEEIPTYANFCPTCGEPTIDDDSKKSESDKIELPPIIYLVANKIDLPEKIITQRQLENKMKEVKAFRYFMVSAKTGENIELMFNSILTDFLRLRLQELRESMKEV